MATVDDLTISYSDDGIETVRELGKEVLSKGAWCTVAYRYQELNKKEGRFGPDKYSLRRYQKKNDAYQMRSKFNISSKEQAHKIIDVLTQWIAEGENQ